MGIELLDLADRWGYIVDVNGIRIKQEYAPALGGNVKMTKEQATKLASLIEQKILQDASAGVDYNQIHDLWNGTRDSQKIIDDEKAEMLAHEQNVNPDNTIF